MTVEDLKAWGAIFGALAVVILVVVHWTRPKIGKAQALEREGKYAAAYDGYAELVVRRSTRFKGAAMKADVTSDEFQKWARLLVSGYISYRAERPKETECEIACGKLKELETQLRSLEHTFQLDSSDKLTRDLFITAWHEAFFGSQRTLPASARIEAEAAFEQRLSILGFKGDRSSHVDGVIYNRALDVGVPFAISRDDYHAGGFMLSAGEWAIVGRIVLSLSDPRSKLYYEARRIYGRHAATFVSVPNEPHVLVYRLTIDETHYSLYG